MAPIDLKIDNFVETVQDSEIVLVDFWAAWCGPCQRFAPIFEAASERHPNVTFAKVDTEDQQDLAGGLDIQAIPTLMAFKQGQLVYREAGLMNGSPPRIVMAYVPMSCASRTTRSMMSMGRSSVLLYSDA